MEGLALKPSPDMLAAFTVTEPELVAETSIAWVWKVRQAGGCPAALKSYKADMGSEAAGFAYLQQFRGGPVAQLYALTETAALLEWLDGPSAGDIARQGDLAAADLALAELASALHCASGDAAPSLPSLAGRFAALLECRVQDLTSGTLYDNIERCQFLATELLRDQQQFSALHGDLHHDNMRRAARGYCAFDAKGLWGERAFELANAFRHPKGCEDVIRQPEVIRRRAKIWAAALQVPAPRLLAWAAVKCALSITWRQPSRSTPDTEAALLSALFDQLDEGS